MKKEELQKLIETTIGPIKKQDLQLDTGETVRIKLTTLTLNGKTPYTPTTFMSDEFTPGMRHFILAAGGGSYAFEEDLFKHGIKEDYIVAIEPKIALSEEDLRRDSNSEKKAKSHPTYNISDISKVFERIKKNPSIGIYRHEVIAPSSAHNSLCAVFIQMTENDGKTPTAVFLQRYFEAADHRTYQNAPF